MSLLGIFLLCFAIALVVGVVGVLMKKPTGEPPSDIEISDEEGLPPSH